MSESTQQASPFFKHNGIKIPIVLSYKDAMFTFKKMGLNLLSIMEDGDNLILSIMSNDLVMLEVWHHYVKDHSPNMEEAIEELEATEMHQFKEAFWQAVVNFSPSPMRPLLSHMYQEVKKGLKQPEKIWKSTLSESSEESED